MPTPGRPRARQRRSTLTRDQILAAAEASFAAEGYGGSSMRTVARAANTSQALLHHHFGTKDGLFNAVLERVRVRTRVFADAWIAELVDPAGPAPAELADAYLCFMTAEAAIRQLRVRQSLKGETLSMVVEEAAALEPGSVARANLVLAVLGLEFLVGRGATWAEVDASSSALCEAVLAHLAAVRPRLG